MVQPTSLIGPKLDRAETEQAEELSARVCTPHLLVLPFNFELIRLAA